MVARSVKVAHCKQSGLRLQMGEDTLILMQGDRLVISKQTVTGGKYLVYAVNGQSVPVFRVPASVVKSNMEVHNALAPKR